jgi:hypothetical protein
MNASWSSTSVASSSAPRVRGASITMSPNASTSSADVALASRDGSPRSTAPPNRSS